MFEQNLELISTTLDTIANDRFDSIPAERISSLKEFGNVIEKNYLGSISLKAGNTTEYRKVLEEAGGKLKSLVSTSSNTELESYLSYFYAHFLLTNEAEKANIVAVNASRNQKSKASGIPKSESIENAFRILKQNNVPEAKVQEIIDDLTLELVFTAHPTEAKSDIEILLLQGLSKVLRSSENHRSQDLLSETEKLMDHIGPKESKPTVLNEVNRNLVYFDQIYSVIPMIHREVKNAASSYYPNIKVRTRPLIKYSSWVGGDRDGHPGVTAEVHHKTAKLHHNRAIKYHIASLEDIEASTTDIKHKLQVKNIINKLERRLSDPGHRHDAYNNSSELISDLVTLNKILSNSLIDDLIVNVETFGFHLAQIDTREHSKKHEEALSDIFSYSEVQNKIKENLNSFSGVAKYDTLSKDEKIEFLSALISNRNLVEISSILKTISQEELNTNNTSRVIRTFQEINKIQKDFSPESATVQITSFTHDSSDVLEAIFLAKESGLVIVKNDGSMSSKVDFMPLFETIEDLENCDKTLSDLFKNETYRKILTSRGNIQTAFLGYSDGTKDGGYAAAYAALWNAPNKIKKACIESGIDGLKWEIFHGRGGSLGRGGGKAGEAISSQANGTILNRIRITEQGEFISFRYSDEEMAFRHLEIRLEALIRASANIREGNKKYDKTLLDIGHVSFNHYRKLFENPGLRPIIEQASPFACIQFSNWGSRPANRWDPSSRLDLEQLRAIPWVVTWNQIRLMVPGFYGMGLAINEMIDNQNLSLDTLQDMYRTSDSFRIMIDHCEMALAKSNIHAASQYRNLLPEESKERDLFDEIMEEHLRTSTIVNKIKDSNRLLDGNSTIQKRIDERNSYTHILNYIQVKLLRDLFGQFETDPEAKNAETKETLRLSILSMKAIAAALQETG